MISQLQERGIFSKSCNRKRSAHVPQPPAPAKRFWQPLLHRQSLAAVAPSTATASARVITYVMAAFWFYYTTYLGPAKCKGTRCGSHVTWLWGWDCSKHFAGAGQWRAQRSWAFPSVCFCPEQHGGKHEVDDALIPIIFLSPLVCTPQALGFFLICTWGWAIFKGRWHLKADFVPNLCVEQPIAPLGFPEACPNAKQSQVFFLEWFEA